MAIEAVGEAQPIAVALTNGFDHPLRLDVAQAYAYGADGTRVAPLPPGEAARRAGGRSMPGAVRSAAEGATRGGFMGALGSAMTGLIQGAVTGGIGVGAAVGAAVGAVSGAVTGASGSGAAPDVAGFEDRALKTTTLAPTFSATGYLYYPAGSYASVEVLLTRDDGSVVPVRVDVTIGAD